MPTPFASPASAHVLRRQTAHTLRLSECKQQILARLLQHLEFSLQHVRRLSAPAHLSSVVVLGLAKGDQGCRLVATLACSKKDSLHQNALRALHQAALQDNGSCSEGI